jgi:DNA polymerase III alpha subunit
MAVRYGFLSIKGLGEVATEALLANQPFASWEDFLERKTSKVNSGVVKLLVKIGAFDSLVPNRRWLEKLIEAEEVKGSDRCSWKIDAPVLISGPMIKKKIDGVATEVLDQRELPCSYDWPSEPREPSKQAGRFKAPKPLPAKCSRACRQYVAIPPPTEDSVEPYTDEDIRQIEIETLGVFLSSTPFDRLSPEDRADASTAVEVLAAPPGNYLVIGMVRSFRPHDDRAGRPMGFLRVTTEQGELDLTVFSATRLAYEQYFEPGRLVAMSIYKDSRGQKLDELVDLDA